MFTDRPSGSDVAVPTGSPGGVPPRSDGRHDTSSALHFDLVSFVFFVVILGGGLPTPLYVIYQKEWGFSSGILTVIFAVYAAGLLVMLLLFGRLSDRIGRRQVLLLSLVVALASTVVFLRATSVIWLIGGRVLSGMSVGLCVNTASAALTDYEPTGNRSRAALVVAVINAVGVGAGPLYAGVLAQYAPDPLTLSFWVLLALILAGFGAVFAIRRKSTARPVSAGPLRQLLRAPRVPSSIRPVFFLAAIGAVIGFALAGIFSGVSPSFLSKDLRILSHAVSGGTVFLMFGCAAIAPFLVRRVPQGLMLRIGAACVPVGLASIATAVWTGLAIPFFVGTILCGTGFGICLRAGIGLLNRITPAEERANVFSAFYVAAYLGLSVPVVGLGVMADLIGLPKAAAILAVVISLLAVPVLVARGDRWGGPDPAAEQPPRSSDSSGNPPPGTAQ